MKIALRIFITLLGVISLAIGFLVVVKNNKMAGEIAELGALGDMLGGALPSAGALKTGGIVAVIGSLFTLGLIVVSFMKNGKNIMIAAIGTLVILVIAYFMQPDYAKGLTGGATSREVALAQLIPGAIAAGLAMLLSKKVNS